jgi:signal transduction histidine kinase
MNAPSGGAPAAPPAAERLNLLTALGRDLLAIHDLPQLLQSALQRVLEYTCHDSGSIMLYDYERQILEVRACTGDPKVQVGIQVTNLQRSVAGHVLLSGQPLVLQGRGEDVGTTWRDYTRNIPSVVCLPLLMAEQQAIGVLVLKSTAVTRSLDGADLATLEILASQLAAVVENARLHAERSRLLADLAERERRLQELVGDLLTAQEEERRRLAYDLHDGLAQVAASTYQHLQALSARYRPRSPAARDDLRQASELARRTVREARDMMASLRPTALDDLGLAVALRLEAESLWARGWEVTFDEPEPIGRLPGLIETTLFRVSQELLTGARRQSGAGSARITVGRDAGSVCLTVQHRGHGPAEPAPQGRRGDLVGLHSVLERIGLLGGSYAIDTAASGATTVSVRVPLDR